MRRATMLILALLLLGALACQRVPLEQATPQPTPTPLPELPGGARAIVLLIVDGMGPEAVGLLDAYLLATDKGPNHFAELYDKGVLGVATTYGSDNATNDSASTATAMSSGIKTLPGHLGVDDQGKCATTIVDLAEARGWSTGLVSTTRVSHATPAGFASCSASRYAEPQVVDQLLERNVDVLLSGGISQWIPENRSAKDYAQIDPPLDGGGKRQDGVDRISRAKELGYTAVFTLQEFESLGAPPDGKLLGLFCAGAFPPAIDRLADDAAYKLPTLEQLTRKALEVLASDKDGMFLMVEAANVDTAEHANDPAWLLSELLEANRTLGLLMSWAAEHPDTLLIAVADHASGGPALTYRAGAAAEGERFAAFDEQCQKEVNLPNEFVWPSFADVRALGWQKHSYDWMINKALDQNGDPAALMQALADNSSYKLTFDQAAAVLASPGRDADKCLDVDQSTLLYPYYESRRSALLARALEPQTNLAWSSGAHTHAPVLVGSIGPGSQHLKGWLDNVEIFRAMKAALR